MHGKPLTGASLRRRIPHFLFLITAGAQLTYGWRPTPAPPQDTPIVLIHGTIHTGTGTVIEDGALAFREGRILFVKPTSQITPADTAGFRVIDLQGMHVYPGLIALNTEVGLREIDLVRATHDYQDVGTNQPSLHAWIAFNTDSRIIPTLRLNGILLVETRVRGKGFAGQSGVLHLDGWNWQDALVRGPAGVHLYFPTRYRARGWWGAPRPPAEDTAYLRQIRELRQFLQNAYQYLYGKPSSQEPATPPFPNLRYETMRPVFEGEVAVFVHAFYPREILEALRILVDEWRLPRVVLVTGPYVWFVAEEVRRRNVPVVYVRPHQLPPRDDLPLDFPFRIPALLDSMGIQVALSVPGSWEVRNLAFQAGTCIGYGLDPETALQMITRIPAELLGIDSLYGTLEPGKSATLIVARGHIWNPPEAHLAYAFIDGREIALTSHQVELYRRYLKRYQQQGLIPVQQNP